MATALFATLDPATGQLRIASAGHLPPLLITDGHAEFLPVAPSRMLGAPPAPAPALEWAGVLPVGATLVLFTDGLVESRSADIDEGLAHLLAAARGGGHVGSRRAVRPAAGRPDRRAPRRRHRPAGADPARPELARLFRRRRGWGDHGGGPLRAGGGHGLCCEPGRAGHRRRDR